jgi:hypothetical protein
MNTIQRIERLALRDVWPHEALHFTKWLEENIEVLNEVLEIELDPDGVEREQAAGAFSIDLVAKDRDGRTVIVENQLERTNHDHLGKLLTYTAAMDAKVAVWVSSDPRPEHIAAVTWLNETTGADFYLIKVEAIRIGGSPAAPLFTRIVGPSAEFRQVGEKKRDLADREDIRHRWWVSLIERSTKVTKLHAHITPSTVSWISTASGLPGVSYIYTVTKGGIGVEIYIDRGKDSEDENLAIFRQLEARKDEIEREFGPGLLEWQTLEDRRACRIRCRRDNGGYRSPEADWPRIQDECISDMARLEKVFRGPIKAVQI